MQPPPATNQSGTDVPSTQQQCLPPRSTVSVKSLGEVVVPPDLLKFTVTVKSSKETLEEAQTSVKRRVDYISQVLRKNGVKNNNFVVSTGISRSGRDVGGSTNPDMAPSSMATVHSEIMVSCDSVDKCETIRNVLTDKLDASVELSPVTFLHTAEAKAKARQESFKKAVSSAKAKAESVTQTVSVQLGPAIEVKELWQEPTQDSPGRQPDAEADGVPSSLHENYARAFITFSSQVAVCFEMEPIRACNHRKCRKH